MFRIGTKNLIMVLLFAFLIPNFTSYASGIEDPGEDFLNFHINELGEYKYKVTARKATSGYRYRTHGIVIHKEKRENFDPINTPATEYRVLPEYYGIDPNAGRDLKEVLAEQADAVYKKIGVTCEEIGSSGGNVTLECKIPNYVLKQVAEELFVGNVQPAQRLYFSNFFQVSDKNGNFEDKLLTTKAEDRAKMYWDIDSIRKPKDPKTGASFVWNGTPSGGSAPSGTYRDLENYYNKFDYYRTSSNIYKVYMDSNYKWEGLPTYNEMDESIQTLDKIQNVPGVLKSFIVEPGDEEGLTDNRYLKQWKAWTTVKLPIDKTITHNSKTWNHQGSVITRALRFEEEYPVTNTNFLERTLQTGIRDMFVIIYYKTNDPPPPEGDIPDFSCTVPSLVSTMKSPATSMQVNGNTDLLADVRGNSKFDVSRGIPVLEDLYANVFTKPELFTHNFSKYEGTCSWDIVVVKPYDISWTESVYDGSECDERDSSGTCISWRSVYRDENRSDTVNSINTVRVTRPYSFWSISDFALYKLTGADVESAVLNGGKVSINTNTVNPVVDLQVEGLLLNHVKGMNISRLDLPRGSKSGGYSKPSVSPSDSISEAKDLAENSVPKLEVRNDKLVVDGETIMDPTWRQESTVDPTAMKEKPLIGNNVLYRSKLSIPTSVKDGVYKSRSNANYSIVKSHGSHNSKVSRDIPVNDVTIRTPVVNYSFITDSNVPFNQTWGTVETPYVGVLGRDMRVDFSNSGQHLNIPGYGNKDYTPYVGTKRVRFTFPVYLGKDYYAENTWVPVGSEGVTLKIPEWAKEGKHTIRTESWAVNAQDMNQCGVNYNGTLGTECASSVYEITLVGRVSGFTVYDIGDFRYEEVFRQRKGSLVWSGFKYWPGLRDKDGQTHSASDKPQLSLPIRPGSHPTQVATTPHNGYPFLFYFDTVGEYWRANAGVKVVPTFQFVPKKGGTPVDVDLYYNTSQEKVIKVGGPKDTFFSRNIRMSDPVRAISAPIREETLGFEYDHLVNAETKNKYTKSEYIRYRSGRNTTIAKGYKDINLNYTTRTLIGKVDNTNGVEYDTQRSSVQRWFGEYHLPIDPFIVAAGTNLEALARTKYGGSITGKEEEFLKGGYIIVNLQIYPYKNGNSDTASIAYDASVKGNANMWEIEKQVRSSTSYLGASFNYRYGDIIMFESDFSVKDDYR